MTDRSAIHSPERTGYDCSRGVCALESQPLVSIVVPIYNAQKTLNRLMETILNQTWHDLDIILVDDGSTDDSLSIARTFEQQDSRVTVISQSNSGVSQARNHGMKKCRGKYIRFVDADDTLPAESTELLVRRAEADGADLVIGGYTEYIRSVGHDFNLEHRDDTLACDQVLPLICRNSNTFFYGVLWNKIFRRALIEHHGISFESGLTYGEDFAFTMDYLRSAGKIAFLKDYLYDYRRSRGSLTVNQAFDCVVHPWRNIQTKRRLYSHLKGMYVARNRFGQYRRKLWLYLFRVGLNK